MRLKLLYFLFLSISSIGIAQNNQKNGVITGKIIDKTTGKPIPYVNVSILENNKIVTGGITQDNGSFSIKNLELKNYTVEFQFIGYKKNIQNANLSEKNKVVNFNTVTLEEEAVQLEGVEIVKEKSIMEQKIDRKVINVGKDLISAGATAGEIMNNIPSVSVDPQTNAISLRGNSNVRILIDGKPTNIDPAQLLQQIPSASIKQIELITNPSAKYNPEGMSGIINIVLNKNAKLGFNGSANTGVTFAKTPKLNSSLDLNYKAGKLNFYGNYGLNTGKYANHGDVERLQPGNENLQLFKFGNHNISHLFKLGVDYHIDEKNTLSIYTNQNIFRGTGDGSTDVDFYDNANTDIYQLFNNKSDNNTQTYNLDYKHSFKKEGHNIEFEANYSKDNHQEYSYFEYPSINNYTNDIENDGNNLIMNLDYVNPLSDSEKLEIGSEARIEKTNNTFDVDNSYFSDFDYKRNIYSIYATYGKQWKKWGMQVGARVENYEIEANFNKVSENTAKIEDKIFTIYPSGYISYNPSEKNSFNFNYSRRVDRPSIQQINPIREWSTPTMDSEGNPALTPQFTNSFELNYTRKTKIGSITSGVFYRMINDEITRVVYTNPNDINRQILSYDNFDNNNAFGVEVSGNLDLRKWWSVNFGIDAYGKKVKGTIETSPSVYEYVETDATNFNARVNNNFKATKNLRFQLFGMYRGRDVGLQFTRKPMWKTDFGASYNIFKGSGTISARVSDIFQTMNFSFDGDKPNKSTGSFCWESRSLYLGFNYKFGSGKNRALQRKQRDKNETQGSGGMM
ncbi:MAG: outer membrane beta-barrel family protein [Flavobacteriaceae bacterium]